MATEREGQVARWLGRLTEFNYAVVHRPDAKHINADPLSRVHCKQCDMHTDNSASLCCTTENESLLPIWSTTEI